MKHKTLSAQLLSVTDGLVGSVTNLVLLQLYFFVSVGGVKTMGDASRVVEEVHGMLDTVNYDTIKRAIAYLVKQELIARPKKRDALTFSITKLGRERIAQLVPTYRTERPWDGHIYLISYDIPKHHNNSRDLLRDYIRRTGGALLQESLWINPYNPTVILEEFVRSRGIVGTVLVSKLGIDGTIGDETLPELISRVYILDELARRYEAFLDAYPQSTKPPKTKITVDYLAILKDDPQLPFALLPKDFPSEVAWKRYQSIMKS